MITSQKVMRGRVVKATDGYDRKIESHFVFVFFLNIWVKTQPGEGH